jgi:hypothetical protein
VMLRRAAPRDGLPGYEIRRYPQHVSVATDYYKRVDAFGTLGAYCNGANEGGQEMVAYTPSLISAPRDERTLEKLQDDTYNGVMADDPKTMRWPVGVPAMGDTTPPQPAGSQGFAAFCKLQLLPSRTVAVLRFSDPTTEPTVRSYANLLRKSIEADGLRADRSDETEDFRLAQFDALNSFGARRSEIWMDLEDGHPWSEPSDE